MMSRERVCTTMAHKETDRVPLFFMELPHVENRLLKDLILADRDALLDYLDINLRWSKPTVLVLGWKLNPPVIE